MQREGSPKPNRSLEWSSDSGSIYPYLRAFVLTDWQIKNTDKKYFIFCFLCVTKQIKSDFSSGYIIYGLIH